MLNVRESRRLVLVFCWQGAWYVQYCNYGTMQPGVSSDKGKAAQPNGIEEHGFVGLR